MSKKLIWTIVAVVAVVAVVCAVIFLKPKTEANVVGTPEEPKTEANVVGTTEEPKIEANLEWTLEEIMAKLYAGIPAENLPMMLGQIPVDAENVEAYLGTTEVSFKEALVSEPMIGSIAHSVVLVRLNDAKDADAAVAKIKESANPRKWICIEASNVVVESKGDLVVLIMSDAESVPTEQHLAPVLEANFNNL